MNNPLNALRHHVSGAIERGEKQAITEQAESDTFTLDCEFTDTFGGEANYSWVRRETLELPKDISDRALVRRAKKALGLNGVRGTMNCYGDMWEFRPHNSCTVAFFHVSC